MSSISKSVAGHPNRARQHLQVLPEDTQAGLVQSPALEPQALPQADAATAAPT